jgi:peptidoglycan/xylan/chitin deacetylase (PgdA/CDA1 family)
VASPERVHDISCDEFGGLLDLLQSPLVVADLAPSMLSQAPIVLTFDDGTADHLAVAETLHERDLPAIFFVSSALLGTSGYLSNADLLAIRKMGHVVGSHAVHHESLGRLGPSELSHELGDSRRALQDLLGESVTLFAPPGGIVSGAVLRAIPRHGYEACRLMHWGLYHSQHERWTIPCVPVTSFTLSSGWVRDCVTARSLPVRMRAVWMMRSVAPTRARAVARAWLHRPSVRRSDRLAGGDTGRLSRRGQAR